MVSREGSPPPLPRPSPCQGKGKGKPSLTVRPLDYSSSPFPSRWVAHFPPLPSLPQNENKNQIGLRHRRRGNFRALASVPFYAVYRSRVYAHMRGEGTNNKSTFPPESTQQTPKKESGDGEKRKKEEGSHTFRG